MTHVMHQMMRKWEYDTKNRFACDPESFSGSAEGTWFQACIQPSVKVVLCVLFWWRYQVQIKITLSAAIYPI